MSSYVDVDFVGCDPSPEPEHSSDVVPKAEPLEGSFPSRSTTSEDPYPSKDDHRMDIDEWRVIDLTAEDDVTSGPYHSTYSTTRTENSEIEGLPRATPSPECDFIGIDDLLGASTTEYGLSLPQNKIKEEALETIDLTGIDDQEDNDSQKAYWNDSGYVSPGSPISEAFVDFSNHGNYVEEARDREKMNGTGLDRTENYRPMSTPPSHRGLVQNVLSAIDPALTDPKDKSLTDAEVM